MIHSRAKNILFLQGSRHTTSLNFDLFELENNIFGVSQVIAMEEFCIPSAGNAIFQAREAHSIRDRGGSMVLYMRSDLEQNRALDS